MKVEKEFTMPTREAVTKVIDSAGKIIVISQLSAEEEELPQVDNPIFTPEELAQYADEYEENGGVCQEMVKLLQRLEVDPLTITKLCYEIAAHGGIVPFVEALNGLAAR